MSEAPKPIKTLVTIDPSNPHYAAVAAVSERKRASLVNQLAAVGFAFQNLGGASRPLEPAQPSPRKAPARPKVERQAETNTHAPAPQQIGTSAPVESPSASQAPEPSAAATSQQAPQAEATPAPTGRTRRKGGFPFNH